MLGRYTVPKTKFWISGEENKIKLGRLWSKIFNFGANFVENWSKNVPQALLEVVVWLVRESCWVSLGFWEFCIFFGIWLCGRVDCFHRERICFESSRFQLFLAHRLKNRLGVPGESGGGLEIVVQLRRAVGHGNMVLNRVAHLLWRHFANGTVEIKRCVANRARRNGGVSVGPTWYEN